MSREASMSVYGMVSDWCGLSGGGCVSQGWQSHTHWPLESIELNTRIALGRDSSGCRQESKRESQCPGEWIG